MRRFYLAMLSIAVLAACGDSGQLLAPPTAARLSALTVTTSEFVPFSSVFFVPCANGGAGEEVLVEGTRHEVLHITANDNGFHVTFQENSRGLTGTGLTTGDTYRSSGSFMEHFNVGPGETHTVTRTFLLVAPGPNNNFKIRETFHFTVNANGELTSEVDSTSVTCS